MDSRRLTEPELQAIQERLKHTSPGPWHSEGDQVFARDGVADTVNCGTDTDTAELDAATVDSAVSECETLARPAITAPTPTPAPTKPKCKKGRKLKKVKGKFKCVKKKGKK